MEKTFLGHTYNFRSVITKAASYTVLGTDELVQINGAYTMTLPVLSTLKGTMNTSKLLAFQNVGTATGTVAAGSGNTINGKASFPLQPNEWLIITANAVDTDWTIVQPYPVPALLRQPFNMVVSTSGTTAQNVVDATGAPADINITAILTVALDTNAGNIVVKNGTNTVATIAKSTTAGLMVAAASLANAGVTKGSTFTAESDSTNGNASVIILGTTQSYA
jgi:hypothetical protein